MLKFILNFILFGVLFYAIYVAFPDAFHKMVGWADSIYELLRDLFTQLSNKLQDWGAQREKPQSPERAVLLLPVWILAAIKFKKDAR